MSHRCFYVKVMFWLRAQGDSQSTEFEKKRQSYSCLVRVGDRQQLQGGGGLECRAAALHDPTGAPFGAGEAPVTCAAAKSH